ncbi:hypothetical protein IE989_01240 [Klebsiella pneumoniae]|nr:hypothetical protein [Klebsiella pneumoniae]
MPWEGRARDDLSGFSLPGLGSWPGEGDTLTIATRQLRVTVHQPLWLEWSYRDEAGEWQPLANDRPTSAYLGECPRRRRRPLSEPPQRRAFLRPRAKRPATCSAPVNATRCVTSMPWATTPSALTRCINIFRSPSPSAAISATACSMTT